MRLSKNYSRREAVPEFALEMPSCVLLDLDNTLYEYAPCHDAGLLAACEEVEAKLGVTIDDFKRLYGQARQQTKQRLGQTAASHSRLLYFQRALELGGIGSQPRHALSIERAYWRSFLSCSKLFPESEEFLDDLRIRGVPIVIVTDLTCAIQMRKYLFWGLDRYTDWIVSSEESGCEKPAAGIFELALAKLGGVEGATWMIGDNVERDAVGAKKSVGATTFIRRTAEGASLSEHVDYLFDDFQELRHLLAGAIRQSI